MNDSEIPNEHLSKREKEHIDAVNKIKYKVERVHMMHGQGLLIKEISKLTGYSRSSISAYLSKDYNVVHGQYGVSRPGILAPYRNEILSLRAQGMTYEEITKRISEKGYSGSVAALRGFVSKEKRIAKDLLKDKEPSELIDKKWIIKLLYKPIEKIKVISQCQLEEVIKKHPTIGRLLEILTEFKNMLVKKESKKFTQWVKKTSELKINELDSYINGLKSDYDSILNAIMFDYNNGLAEGSVNKLKNIKRVMYGRNSFELLRFKVIQLEKLKNN